MRARIWSSAPDVSAASHCEALAREQVAHQAPDVLIVLDQDDERVGSGRHERHDSESAGQQGKPRADAVTNRYHARKQTPTSAQRRAQSSAPSLAVLRPGPSANVENGQMNLSSLLAGPVVALTLGLGSATGFAAPVGAVRDVGMLDGMVEKAARLPSLLRMGPGARLAPARWRLLPADRVRAARGRSPTAAGSTAGASAAAVGDGGPQWLQGSRALLPSARPPRHGEATLRTGRMLGEQDHRPAWYAGAPDVTGGLPA